MLGLIMLALFVVCALFAPIITPYDAVEQNIDGLLIPPSWLANGSISHIFGTDALGRDLFTRIIYGCRITLGSAFITVVLVARTSSLQQIHRECSLPTALQALPMGLNLPVGFGIRPLFLGALPHDAAAQTYSAGFHHSNSCGQPLNSIG